MNRRIFLQLPMWLASSRVLAETLREFPLLTGQRVDSANHPLPPRENTRQLMSYLGNHSEILFTITPYPWKRALALAAKGVGPIWALSRTPEREEIFAFSHAVSENVVWMVVRKNDPMEVDSISGLEGKRVSIFSGASFGAEFDEARNRLFTVEEDPSGNLSARFAKLLAGRCDVLLVTKHATEYAAAMISLEKSGYDAGQMRLLKKPLLRDALHLAIAKSRVATFPMDDFNHAVDVGRKRGDIDRILAG